MTTVSSRSSTFSLTSLSSSSVRAGVFEIQCEKFEYSGETFSTVSDIDDTPLDTEFYKTEFTLDAGGVDTLACEQVTIYDVSNVETPTIDVPGTIDPFRVYDNEGLLEDVPS